jgi:hypothetical protein
MAPGEVNNGLAMVVSMVAVPEAGFPIRRDHPMKHSAQAWPPTPQGKKVPRDLRTIASLRAN